MEPVNDQKLQQRIQKRKLALRIFLGIYAFLRLYKAGMPVLADSKPKTLDLKS